MPIVFFEGFNSSDTDAIKLDTYYWSTNDESKISFVGGRTDNQINLANRPILSGLQYNNTLSLSNFSDPLVSHSGIGLGFYSPNYSLRTNNTAAGSPYAETLLSFYDNAGEVLKLDIIKTIYNSSPSVGLALYQNSTLVDVYDFESVLGNTWSIYSQADTLSIQESSYIEFYIDALNGNFAVRFSANNSYETYLLNSSNNIYTTITPFNNLSGITWYSTNDGISNHYRGIDDLYLTAGNSVSECLLGNNTKIYRKYPNSDTAIASWLGGYGGSVSSPSYSYVDDNDGDTGYIFSSTSGDACLFGMTGISEPAPSGVGGVKVINIVKKSMLDSDMSFINIMTSGNNEPVTEIGSGHLVDSTAYSYKTSFFFNNPLTSAEWTKQEITDMELGVKII
jgi:hypothetical protein